MSHDEKINNVGFGFGIIDTALTIVILHPTVNSEKQNSDFPIEMVQMRHLRRIDMHILSI